MCFTIGRINTIETLLGFVKTYNPFNMGPPLSDVGDVSDFLPLYHDHEYIILFPSNNITVFVQEQVMVGECM